MKTRNSRRIALVLLGGFLATGCATETPESESDTENVGAVAQQTQRETQRESSVPDPSSPSAVTAAFDIGSNVHALDSKASVALRISNHSQHSITTSLDLRLRGLGAKRVVSWGAMSLSAGETRVVPWLPTTSPIAPTGTSASVLAFVSYDVEGHTLSIPSQPITFSFEKNGGRVFLSSEDGLGVRLASLGLAKTGTSKSKPTVAERAAVLAELGAHRGKLDGSIVDESSAQVARRLPNASRADEVSDEGDAVPLPGTIESSGVFTDDTMSSKEMVASQSSKLDGPILLRCNLSLQLNTKKGKYCANWQPQGFRDVGVSSGVVAEDFLGEGPAAYASAIAMSGSTALWVGTRDEFGCTPSLEFCEGSEQLGVATSSFQVPPQLFSVTRRIQIEPATTYPVSPSYRYSSTFPPYEVGVVFNVNSGQSTVRVASIVSRILRMGDSGLLEGTIFQPAPPLVIHADDGCPYSYLDPPRPPDFHYTDPVTGQLKYGEACGGADEAWFGQTLSLQGTAQTGYYYAPTAWHTTQDAVTIGHELGHSAQYARQGGPGGGDYNDKPGSGDCSCEWVTRGIKRTASNRATT